MVHIFASQNKIIAQHWRATINTSEYSQFPVSIIRKKVCWSDLNWWWICVCGCVCMCLVRECMDEPCYMLLWLVYIFYHIYWITIVSLTYKITLSYILVWFFVSFCTWTYFCCFSWWNESKNYQTRHNWTKDVSVIYRLKIEQKNILEAKIPEVNGAWV